MGFNSGFKGLKITGCVNKTICSASCVISVDPSIPADTEFSELKQKHSLQMSVDGIVKHRQGEHTA